MVLFQGCFVRSLTKERSRDTKTNNKAECFHSLHDPVFKSLSSAIKEAIFGKSLLVHLETIRQVAKIDHAH